MKYRVLWLLEIVLGALLLFVMFVPIQDYALREYKEYLGHPSPETLKVFKRRAKKNPSYAEALPFY